MPKEIPPLEEMTLRQLRKQAQKYEISRYSRMRKDQLLAEIKQAKEVAESAVMLEHAMLSSFDPKYDQTENMEAKKFDLGNREIKPVELLADVDAELGDLPQGYGESRIVLMPRDPQWAYAYWDITNDLKEEKRSQGGQQLVLRLYDSTNVDLDRQAPHSVQEYYCDELAKEWHLPIPVSDRDYTVEIGYRTNDGKWLPLCRSASVRIPPTYPSDWVDDHFVTVNWEQSLRGAKVFELGRPTSAPTAEKSHEEMYGMAKEAESQRVAGSAYGSQQMSGAGLETESISSYVFPSGVGSWSGGAVSGVGMGASEQTMSGAGALTASGAGMSGIGALTASGISGSGIAALTTSGSGVGFLTTSGVGMSGIGALTASGISGSGIGYVSASGVGMSGIAGLTASGISGSGIGYVSASGVGMSGIAGLTASGISGSGIGYVSASGVGMSGIAGLTASGISGSGIGYVSASGVGMSGIAGLTASGISGSGIGYVSASGVGMSGIAGLTASGISGSGIGYVSASGVGMSGIAGLTASGISGSGIGYVSASGVGMSGIAGLTASGISGSGIGYLTTSGMGMSGAGYLTASGMGMSGVGALTTSGLGMSGIGYRTTSGMGMSGVGLFSGSGVPKRPRQFWLVADAELIVYGATEPDANVTIAGRPVKLESDGTFRFHMSFPDGLVDFPIFAVAADGEQTRSIHMKFERQTLDRNTNTKEEAVPEWIA
ncbi:Rho termination factor domain protein [Thalassoporum mexicanum PCC 7367]|uniref:DUF4912 domain-containing protein n=1 Tax=Thalassoporum mexicanum TaxID=3457544 RepID=UPI00029FEA94|nr:DUF4912 domain-containing protein [Pseudanabaena sp. PCC 7367]AFY69570.1 Rho termination factor domain protein [Pseudanabaena sp. PCC 7367]